MTSVSECITFYEIDIKNSEEDEEKENFVEYCKKNKTTTTTCNCMDL